MISIHQQVLIGTPQSLLGQKNEKDNGSQRRRHQLASSPSVVPITLGVRKVLLLVIDLSKAHKLKTFAQNKLQRNLEIDFKLKFRPKFVPQTRETSIFRSESVF